MDILYIIGNGFDLFHGLPTKYTDFRNHSGNNVSDFENCYCYFGLEDEDGMWHDFENKLGEFDNEIFFYNHCLNDQCESWVEGQGVADDITEQADHLVEKIQEDFTGWIESIDVSAAKPLLSLSSDAKYFSFNYTSVLQYVYNISSKQICHIHGSASQYESLVFGHGKQIEEEPEVDENGDSNRTMYTDAESAAKYPLHALKKDVLGVIDKNHVWFKSLGGVNTVVILGHSLNDIDLQYFQELHKHIGEADWMVSYYDQDELCHHRSQLVKVGIPNEKITCRHINSWNE